MATITQRGDAYHIMVSCGYDVKNRQIRRCMNWRPEPGMTQKQIEKAVNEAAVLFENKVRQGQVLDGSITFAEFIDRWMTEYAEKQLAPKTYHRYVSFMQRIIPALGHIRMDKLQPIHLIEFYNQLAGDTVRKDKSWVARPALIEKYRERNYKSTVFANEAKIGTATLVSILNRMPVTRAVAEKVCDVMMTSLTRGFKEQEGVAYLGKRTVKHHHALISSILTTAVNWQVILENPAKRVKAPKAPRLEAKFLDELQTARLLECLDGEPIKYQVMVKLLLYSGMRRGELAGLEWKDIDFDKGTISIRRSSQYVSGKGIFTKDTKTETSDRTIRLPQMAFDMLKTYRAWQSKERLKIGSDWLDCDRLFTTWNGSPIHPDSITGWFAAFIKRHELPKITIHSLRHTNITLLIMAGIPLRTVAKRAGHSSTVTTSLIYSHAIQSADEMASGVLEDILKPKRVGSG
jgi:integrase